MNPESIPRNLFHKDNVHSTYKIASSIATAMYADATVNSTLSGIAILIAIDS